MGTGRKQRAATNSLARCIIETLEQRQLLSSISGAAGLVTAAINQPPTTIILSSTTIAENRPVGTTVGDLYAMDPDTGDTFTYTMVTGPGSADNTSFRIAGSQFLTNSVFDYETRNSYTVRVRATDAGGLYTEMPYTIEVQDCLERPQYDALRDTYSGFGLPADPTGVNIIEISTDQLSSDSLTQAIATAGTTALPDLIAVHTSDARNTIDGGIEINIDDSVYGSVTIIGLGPRPLTIDAGYGSRVVKIGMTPTASEITRGLPNFTNTVNLGGLVLTNGRTTYDSSMSMSDSGGGIYARKSTLNVANCTIRGNEAASSSLSGSATLGGGGIFAYSCTVMIQGSLITNNRSGPSSSGTVSSYGGGVSVPSGTLAITNSEISGNSVAGNGGGISCGSASGGTMTLTNVTISGNRADGEGGGIYLVSSTSALRNSVVARNQATAGTGVDLRHTGAALSGANDLIGDGTGQSFLYNGVSGNLVGSKASPIDPKFTSSDNLHLLPTSPAVDAGDATWIPAGVTTDRAGGPRISGGTVDMGAYERDVDAPTLPSVSINGGAVQRSMVKTIAIVFGERVVVDNYVITVMTSTGTLPPGTSINLANPSGDQRTYVLTFSGSATISGSLADGIYELNIPAAGVKDLAGNAMTATHTQRFHRLFGDVDGNRVVNALDYAKLKATYGRSSTDGLFNGALDYEGNGVINALDLAQFRKRYGMSVAY